MYPRYIMPQNYRNMYRRNNFNNRNDRFFGGSFIAPLLLGGIAGYALGRPNCYGPNCFYGNPYPNYYYNNFYYW